MVDKGILYIATGREFVKEAAISARTVQQHMPELPIAIITDTEPNADVFDIVEVINRATRGFADQIQYLSETPFDKTLCIDTDIYVDAPVDDLFDVLDEFDIAVAHNHDRSAFEVSDVPAAFPEYNTGVLAYKMSEQFRAFLNV